MYVCMYECTTVAPGTHRVSLLHIDIVSDSTYSSVCGTCRACVCMYVCMYVAHLGHVYVCMYVWMDGCMYVCMYVLQERQVLIECLYYTYISACSRVWSSIFTTHVGHVVAPQVRIECLDGTDTSACSRVWPSIFTTHTGHTVAPTTHSGHTVAP